MGDRAQHAFPRHGLAPDDARLHAAGLRHAIDVPLMDQGEPLGLLRLAGRAPLALDREATLVIHEIADEFAIAIHQADLREQVRRHTHELEALVAQRTGQLQEVNEGLQAFAYSVSHDLRAPLRRIHGFATALAEDYGARLNDEGRRHLERIVTSARRMDALVTDLLAFSRLTRAEIRVEPVALQDLVRGVLERLAPQVEVARAEVTVEPGLTRVRAHTATLSQVVENLLTTALKFVPPGTTPRVQVRAEPRDEWVRLWVEDNGIGIAPEHHARIFRVFERLHSEQSYPGTGVGLAIVQKGVERMSGRVGVESEPGRGSRFWIELPAG